MAKIGFTIFFSILFISIFADVPVYRAVKKNAAIRLLDLLSRVHFSDGSLPDAALESGNFFSQPVLKPVQGTDTLTANITLLRSYSFFLNASRIRISADYCLNGNSHLAFNYPSHSFW